MLTPHTLTDAREEISAFAHLALVVSHPTLSLRPPLRYHKLRWDARFETSSENRASILQVTVYSGLH